METTVWTFSLSVPFAQWAAIYDSEDVAKMHAAVGIKSLYRGVSKEDPSKVCAVQQAPVGVAQKLFEENKEMIRGAGHVIESTVISAYSES
tara:strand:- start:756 stop:1028 length:273 start_codon:yes stop_codon:yes gene_type:complete